jgi:hypothetical protein
VVTAAVVSPTVVAAAVMAPAVVTAALVAATVVTPAVVAATSVAVVVAVVAEGRVADADDVDAVAADVHRHVHRRLDRVTGTHARRAAGVSAGMRAP